LIRRRVRFLCPCLNETGPTGCGSYAVWLWEASLTPMPHNFATPLRWHRGIGVGDASHKPRYGPPLPPLFVAALRLMMTRLHPGDGLGESRRGARSTARAEAILRA
jgi:hypothetical protein